MARQIGETWKNDGPDATCFGCGHRNERGLKMVFTRTGPLTVEATWEAEPHWCGAPSVVHGGIQAALLDEVMGIAGHCGYSEDGAESFDLVTAEFQLRYRRPVPAGVTLHLEGRVDRVEGRDVFIEGEIRDAGGEVLTRGEARWRKLGA